jgi:hypothetical protein
LIEGAAAWEKRYEQRQFKALDAKAKRQEYRMVPITA